MKVQFITLLFKALLSGMFLMIYFLCLWGKRFKHRCFHLGLNLESRKRENVFQWSPKIHLMVTALNALQSLLLRPVTTCIFMFFFFYKMSDLIYIIFRFNRTTARNAQPLCESLQKSLAQRLFGKVLFCFLVVLLFRGGSGNIRLWYCSFWETSKLQLKYWLFFTHTSIN